MRSHLVVGHRQQQGAQGDGAALLRGRRRRRVREGRAEGPVADLAGPVPLLVDPPLYTRLMRVLQARRGEGGVNRALVQSPCWDAEGLLRGDGVRGVADPMPWVVLGPGRGPRPGARRAYTLALTIFEKRLTRPCDLRFRGSRTRAQFSGARTELPPVLAPGVALLAAHRHWASGVGITQSAEAPHPAVGAQSKADHCWRCTRRKESSIHKHMHIMSYRT